MLIMHSERERTGKRDWHSAKERVKRQLSQSVCGSEHGTVGFFQMFKSSSSELSEAIIITGNDC